MNILFALKCAAHRQHIGFQFLLCTNYMCVLDVLYDKYIVNLFISITVYAYRK